MPDSRHQVPQTPVAWLEAYRSGGPWLIAAHTPDGNGMPCQTFHDPDEMAEWIERKRTRKDIFFTVNPAVRDMSRKPKKTDIARVEYLHVDLDTSTQLKLNAVPPPTFVNDSSNGLHLFWKLRTPSTDFKLVEATNRALAEALGATPETANADRLRRLH